MFNQKLLQTALLLLVTLGACAPSADKPVWKDMNYPGTKSDGSIGGATLGPSASMDLNW